MKNFVLACALVCWGCSAEIGGAIVEQDPDAPSARLPGEKPDVCGNGLDDNGNGFIDDQCSCRAGQTQGCWPGDPMQRKVGACRDGVQTCNADDSEFPKWGPCVGAVLPSPDTSEDGVDQDCDGHGEILRCVPVAESCTDKIDNDCDGKVDCADSNCAGNAACAPVCVATTENCTDGKDNDCDGKIDCADSNCLGNAACAPACVPTTENCTDGKDNDCDGKVDCADSNCATNQACAPPPVCEPFPHWEVCGDGKDNECDGKTDCEDPECWGDETCTCTETCTPGAMRWCDEAQYCHWGQQTCGPDKRWGACREVNTHPQGCGSLLYDDDCCVDAGQCCQALHLLTPLPYSVGTCAPVSVTCTAN